MPLLTQNGQSVVSLRCQNLQRMGNRVSLQNTAAQNNQAGLEAHTTHVCDKQGKAPNPKLIAVPTEEKIHTHLDALQGTVCSQVAGSLF